MSDLNKLTDEYTWDDSDELPGDVAYYGSLLNQDDNNARRKLFDPDAPAEDPPRVTIGLPPCKLEICGDVVCLMTVGGKAVVTCVSDPVTNMLNVLFENENIDFDDNLKRGCCDDAGELFSCTIGCRNTDDLKKCISGFIQLTADGYALPMKNLIGMDLRDVESAIAKGTNGIYRTALVDPAELKKQTIALLRSALNAKRNAAGVILRLEGVWSLNQIGDCLDHVAFATDSLNIELCVMASIQYSGDDPCRIDVWAF